MSASYPHRYHGLDALRAFAMLLGLPLHAALVYMLPEMTVQLGFTGPPPEPDMGTLLLVLWVHAWRMPVFFIVAGFFALMIVERRGYSSFLKDRSIRIFGALVIFSTILNVLSQDVMGTLGHLWFLYYLSFFIAVFALGHWVWVKWAPRFIVTSAAGCFQSSSTMLILAVPLTVLTYFARDLGIETLIPLNYGDFRPASFFYFLAWFLIGVGVYQNRDHLLGFISRPSLIVLCLTIGNISTIMAGVGYEWVSLRGVTIPFELILSANSAVASCFMSAGIIGLFHRVVGRPSKLASWLVELSYPIYLVHVPIIVLCSLVWLYNPIAPSLAIWASSLMAFPICVMAYYALIKFTPLNWVVNGYKKSWFKMPGKVQRA